MNAKRFQSNESGDVVTIINDTGVFYSLSNGANIKKDIFFQKYSEMLDPSSFFQQQSAAGLSDLTEKIRTVNTDNIRDIGGTIPPGVKVIQEAVSEQVPAPPEYREMLMRRFKEEEARKDLSQYKVYEDEDEAAADFERRQRAQQPPRRPPVMSPRQQQELEDQINNRENQYTEQTSYTPPPSQPSSPPPTYTADADEEAWRFFKSFKRIYPIKLSVDFDERIAEPNFIKLMANNFESDIIKYYTKQIMDRIYNDPGFLENKIYEKLRSLVFDEKEKKPRTPRTPKAPATKKPEAKKRSIPSVPKEDRAKLQEGGK